MSRYADNDDARALLSQRGQWPRWLTALPAGEVYAAVDALTAGLTVEDVDLPQAGLGLLKIPESTQGEPYYLGEIPLARAHVRVRADDGREAEGAAQLLDDRVRLARAVAVCDALLAARLPGWEDLLPLLQVGREQAEARQAERRALLANTRVDFSLLGSTEEDDDDV